ncbi:MAG: hypothetical protein IJY66_04345 [Clostridia bacterium]|nr:hypothetical protein [Clostridia bacterium]
MSQLTYLENRTAYYTLFISELTNTPIDTVYEKIAPIFLTANTPQLHDLLHHECLCTMHSVSLLDLYMNFIHAFGASDDAFGLSHREDELLRMKRQVLDVTEKLKSTPFIDPLAALYEYSERNDLGTMYALTLYYCNPMADNAYIAALKKGVKGAEGLDCCLALLYLNEDRRSDWFDTFSRNALLPFHPGLRDRVAAHYGLGCNGAAAKNS